MNFSTGSMGGGLNSAQRFNIRGQGTIGAGSSVSPLVLIDGMEGSLNSLNPQDIENISVLKDASASSIYGSRAAGGVILVTTKQGKEGKVTINYNNSFRFNSPLNLPRMMDSYTWAQYVNHATINEGAGVWFSDNKLDQIKRAQNDPSMRQMFVNPKTNKWEVWDENDILPIGSTDFLREHFKDSFSQEHNISMSGGSKKLRYYLSGNVLDRGGNLRYGNDNAQRYTLMSKVDIDLAEWVTMTYNMRFSRNKYDGPSWVENSQFYHDVMRRWPIIPTKDPNGHYNPETLIPQLLDGGRRNYENDATAHQLSFVIRPFEGLVLNAELNYRVTNNNGHIDWQTVYGMDANENPYVAANSTTSVKETNYKSHYWNPNIFAEYSFSFNEAHNFKTMLGFQCESLEQRYFDAEQKGIIGGLTTLNTTTSDPKVSGAPASWTTAGFFGRINYDYLGRYLFEANLRYDGSSRFLADRRWNFFPSFSTGWNIAREEFWMDKGIDISTLKLRGSYGLLGNQNTDNWYPFYPKLPFNVKGGTWLVNGERPNVAGEPALVSSSLTWEKSQTWEVGLDWAALNNRFTGSIGYFQRKTFDMVGPAPELPDVLGTDVPKVNNLDMTSRGWELQASWRDQVGDFQYGVSFMLSDNQVTIDKYPNASKNLAQRYYVGSKLGDIWGYRTIGIAKTDQEMQDHLSKVDQSALGNNWAAGDIMYADLNGDGKINGGAGTADDSGDRTIIGNRTPRYNFGLNFDSSWKGFDLKIFFQGVMKRDYAPVGDDAVFWGASGISKWQAVGFTGHLDFFRPDPNDPLGQNLDSYYPRANFKGGKNNYTQTRYLQNGAYCRLKNVTLGYTLPTDLTSRVGIRNLRFFVSGENLLTLTKFTKLGDPELIDATGGWGFGKVYPLSKTVSLGMSASF